MKRTVSFLLVLVLIFGMIPLSAMALEPAVTFENYTHINPLYADVITEADLVPAKSTPAASIDSSDSNYSTTFEGAGAQMRPGMVAREETIVVYYQTKNYNSAQYKDILNAAVAHTGNPKEGDALRWVYGGYRVSITRSTRNGVTYAKFTYTMTYYTTAEQEKELDAAMSALLAEVDINGTDYERLCHVYDWICENITYDYDTLYDEDYKLKFTAYAAMINGTAVCQGYAVLLYQLALKLGIDCRVITGIGNTGGHGWNIIKLGNVYYNIDPTWDAIWYQALGYYKYFLQCEETFTSNYTDHYRNAEYDTTEFHSKYPMSATNYDPNDAPIETPHEHNYTETVIAPTCSEEGYSIFRCNCGSEYTANYTFATGHTPVIDAAVAPTCTTPGWTEGSHCSVCEVVITLQSEVPATGHYYTGVTFNPTCTASGYTKYSCILCGDSYTVDNVGTAEHDYHNGTCSVCGHVAIEAPTATSTNKTSTGKITVKWNAVDGAVKYEVYRATSKTGKYSCMKTLTTTSYTNTTAKPGVYYYYYVRAYDADNNYADSNIVGRTCDLAQTNVTLSNVASSGKIQISWDAVEGATKYQVYRATSKDGTYSKLTTTSGTTVTNTKTTAGTTYYYKVRAICDVDAATGAFSEVKSRTCDLPRPVVTLSNVASSGKIKISWEKVDGAVKYEVSRASSKDGTYSRLTTTSNTSVTNTSTTAGETYYYKVKAIAQDSAANSAYSEVKSRTCDLPRPEVSISLSSGKPKVSWTNIDGAVSYKVYRATSEAGSYSLMKTSTGSYYKNTSAVAGTTYYYKVVAVCSNTSGNSAYSKAVSVTATK